MKTIFLLLFVLAGLSGKANDTLTRQEIYDFAVGDTFDYKDHYISTTRAGSSGPIISSTDTTTFERFVVSNIFLSADSGIKYIERQRLFPFPMILDTIKLDPADGYEIVLHYNSQFPGDIFTVSGLPAYMNQPTNLISYIRGYTRFNATYAKALGLVTFYSYGGAMGYSFSNITELVYYSGANGTMGHPYTDYPTGNTEIALPEQKIKLYQSAGQTLNVKVPDIQLLPLQLEINDVQGRLVASVIITKPDQEIFLPQSAQGIYVWQALLPNNRMAKGRVFVK